MSELKKTTTENYKFENKLIFSFKESNLDKESFIKAINTLIEQSETLGVVYGELEAPKDYDIHYQNISHAFTNIRLDGDNVFADVSILSTKMGEVIRTLMDAYDTELTPFCFKPRHHKRKDGTFDEIYTFDIFVKEEEITL